MRKSLCRDLAEATGSFELGKVVGQQEAQRLSRKHLALDGNDLMGQWLDEAQMNRESRVE